VTHVFLLWHVRPGFSEFADDEQAKLLGVFSTEEKARAWQEDAGSLPGFAEAPDGFILDNYNVDERHWTTGFMEA
jgi:hypothetical protein